MNDEGGEGFTKKHKERLKGLRPTACGYVRLRFQYVRKAL